MTCTLSIPLQITFEIHEIQGGGFWAEVVQLPGCVAQAESLESLKANMAQAIKDWWEESSLKTEAEARQLAEIQGSKSLADASFPRSYEYSPPPLWTDEDD